MSFLSCRLVLVASLLVSESAGANPPEAREKAARAACLAGDYAKGIAILSELFVESKDASLIYNQGRCFEQNHRYEDAIARFQEYLRVGTKLRKGAKAEAQKHIADCRGLLAQQVRTHQEPPTEPHDTKEAKERAARRACLTGDTATGVGILTDLFIDTKDTTHIFNQGRCFEQNGRCDEAINRFREYLRKSPNLSSETKADTEKHIADCLALSDPKTPPETKSETAETKPEPTRETTKESAQEVAPGSRESVTRPLVTPADGAPDSGSNLRTAGIACGVVGVASIATAIYFYARARSLSDKVSNQDPVNPSDLSAGENAETMQWVFYGVGGAALATGAVLYTLGWRASSERTVFAPMIGRGVAGISARRAF